MAPPHVFHCSAIRPENVKPYFTASVQTKIRRPDRGLCYSPAKHKEGFDPGLARHASLQCLNQAIPLLHDLVFHIEDLLPLAALLLLKVANLGLSLVLLFQSRGSAGLPVQSLDLLLGRFQLMFRSQHHIIGPPRQPLTLFVEEAVVALHRKADCGLDRPPTDEEFNSAYSAIRRRPDGKSMGLLHNIVWQSACLALALRPWSAKECEAVFRQLARSARTFKMGPSSRNYMAYLESAFTE
jgi:hypothetical protein